MGRVDGIDVCVYIRNNLYAETRQSVSDYFLKNPRLRKYVSV